VFEDRPDLAEPRTRLWDLIERTPNLIWMLLTKRIENAGLMWPAEWKTIRTPSNVWVGITAENQAMADLRIPYLLGRTAAVRFVSCEPLLGPIDLRAGTGQELLTAGGIGWVICGGESGPERREMDLAWAADLQAQCHRAGIPFFMKQDGGYRPGERGRIPDNLWERAFPAAARREMREEASKGAAE
jgi:protein gp37